METVTFSCLVCFKPIENNAGSVLSCGHFICDKCAIQPERCPVCNEECAAQSLLSADEEVKGYLMAPDQVINRAQAVFSFQYAHFQELQRLVAKNTERLNNKCNDLSRQLAAEKSERQSMTARLSSLMNEQQRRSGSAGLARTPRHASINPRDQGQGGATPSSRFFSSGQSSAAPSSLKHQLPPAESPMRQNLQSGSSEMRTPLRQQHQQNNQQQNQQHHQHQQQQHHQQHHPAPPTPQYQHQQHRQQSHRPPPESPMRQDVNIGATSPASTSSLLQSQTTPSSATRQQRSGPPGNADGALLPSSSPSSARSVSSRASATSFGSQQQQQQQPNHYNYNYRPHQEQFVAQSPHSSSGHSKNSSSTTALALSGSRSHERQPRKANSGSWPGSKSSNTSSNTSSNISNASSSINNSSSYQYQSTPQKRTQQQQQQQQQQRRQNQIIPQSPRQPAPSYSDLMSGAAMPPAQTVPSSARKRTLLDHQRGEATDRNASDKNNNNNHNTFTSGSGMRTPKQQQQQQQQQQYRRSIGGASSSSLSSASSSAQRFTASGGGSSSLSDDRHDRLRSPYTPMSSKRRSRSVFGSSNIGSSARR